MGGRVGITDIPDSRIRGQSGLGLGAGKQNTGLSDSRTLGASGP